MDHARISRPSPAAEPERPAVKLARLLGERLYRAVGLLFLLALFLYYIDAIVYVLLIAFIGSILAMAIHALVLRIPLRRPWAIGAVALLLVAGVVGSVWFAVSFLAGQLRSLMDDMPALVASMEEWEAWFQRVTGLDLELFGPRLEGLARELFGGVGGGTLLAGAFGVLEVVAISALVIAGAFFVVARPNEQLLLPLMRAIPRERRGAATRIFNRLGERLSGWLFGTLLSMLIIGSLACVALFLIGAPYPLLLGVLIGLTDIIPLVGPWIGGAIAVVVTLMYDPGAALWVALAVLVIQEVEGKLVRPFVMSGSAKLHPFVTLLSLLLFGSLFGFLGAVLALPITLALGTLIEVLWVEETLHAEDDEIPPVVRLE